MFTADVMLDCGNLLVSETGLKQPPGVPIPGAFTGVRKIWKAGLEPIIVSRCPPYLEGFCSWYFDRVLHFWSATGLARDHLIFCPEYTDKVPICRGFGVRAVVDDRPEVLLAFEEVGMPAIIAFNLWPWQRQRYATRPWIHVPNWDQLLSTLLPQEQRVPSFTRAH